MGAFLCFAGWVRWEGGRRRCAFAPPACPLARSRRRLYHLCLRFQGYTGTFDRDNGGGFLTDHFPGATKVRRVACCARHAVLATLRAPNCARCIALAALRSPLPLHTASIAPACTDRCRSLT